VKASRPVAVLATHHPGVKLFLPTRARVRTWQCRFSNRSLPSAADRLRPKPALDEQRRVDPVRSGAGVSCG